MNIQEAWETLRKSMGGPAPVETLRESNRRKIGEHLTNAKEYRILRESVKRKTKGSIDIADAEKFPVDKIDWSALHDKMREADSISTFTQLLRAGINNIANKAYQSVETTFEEWVTVTTTDLLEVPYAPLQGIKFPREVGPQQKYPQVRAAGLDLKLRSRKFGSIYPAELELTKFDQTGQILENSGRLMGEYLRLVGEVYTYGKLASISGGCQYDDLVVPKSETQPASEAVYPWAPPATPLTGGGITRPTTFTGLDQTAIQNADIQLMNQLNLLGLKINARGTRLIVGPYNKFTAAVLLNSSFFPTAQASGVGTFQSINPIKGLYDLTVSRFVANQNGEFNSNSKAWYLIDGSKPWFVMQMTEGATVVQEDPNSGESFDRDIVRFKGRTMLNCDFIDPRFAYQGNDGSV